MRRTAPALLTTLLAAGLLPLATPSPAAAAPTCYAPVPTVLCGGRVVAEPEVSTSFHQYDAPFESVKKSLEAIEARSPGFLEAGPVSEFTGNPEHVSFGGRDIWVVRVTDETVARAGKKQVAASLSVHGLESAGREGGLRYLEDLAVWTADLAAGRGDRTLYSGGVERPVSQVMAQTESWFAFTNPDGWATGDLTSRTAGGFRRGNDNGAGPVSTPLTSGKDLNRDFATVGWYDRNGGRGIAESEPETRAWVSLVESFPDLVTSTDIHGELTTPNQAFADLIIPAGQWTPTRQQQVKQLGDNMIGSIDRKFREEGVVLDRVFGPLPDADGRTPRRPANVAASYDIVGYDDSGFMGDWFSQRQDSVHMDVENFLSNLAPNNVYTPAVEEAHVAAVRGILESVVVEAMVTRDVRPALTARSFAYVDDPNRTTSADGTMSAVVAGETQVPYDVTRMRYFEEIERTTGRAAVPVSAEAIAAGTAGLAAFDSLVLADMDLPKGSTADRGRYVAALRAFTEAGGQLVLTDQAVTLVDDLTGNATLAHTVNRTDAGHVDFVGALGDHPYEKGLVGKPSQTYYEVMLGFPSRGRTPNYGIERGAFERAGGTTVATVGPQDGPSPNTALGTLPLGEGTVVVFGALLPQAIEQLVLESGQVIQTPHPFGLADYAVTITGGQVLDNVLAFARKDGSTGAGTGPATTPSATPSAGTTAPASPAPPVPGPPSPTADATPGASPSGPTPTSSPSGAAPVPACTTPTEAVALQRSEIVSGQSAGLRVQGEPGALLDLHAYTRPSTTYRVVRSVRLGPDGTAALALTPQGSTRMYAQQRGCPAGPSSAVTVRASVSLDAARTGTRTYRFAGNSLPKRAGGLPVALYRVRPDGTEVLVARTRTDGRTGRWSLTRTFSGTGRLAFVARTSQDTSNAAGASAVRTVTVR